MDMKKHMFVCFFISMLVDNHKIKVIIKKGEK